MWRGWRINGPTVFTTTGVCVWGRSEVKTSLKRKWDATEEKKTDVMTERVIRSDLNCSPSLFLLISNCWISPGRIQVSWQRAKRAILTSFDYHFSSYQVPKLLNCNRYLTATHHEPYLASHTHNFWCVCSLKSLLVEHKKGKHTPRFAQNTNSYATVQLVLYI